jgi:hypothetical protein
MGKGAVTPKAFSGKKPASKPPFSRKRNRHILSKRNNKQKGEIDRKKRIWSSEADFI